MQGPPEWWNRRPPEVVERYDNGLGNLSEPWWEWEEQGHTGEFKRQTDGAVARRGASKWRLINLRALMAQRHALHVCGEPEPENWGYGESGDYSRPTRTFMDMDGEFHIVEQRNRVYGESLALADMGYTGPAGDAPAAGYRRCTEYIPDKMDRCDGVALDGRHLCSACTLRSLRKRDRRHSTQMMFKVVKRMDTRYRGILGEKAREWFGEGPLDAAEELALARAVLQEAIKLVESQGGVQSREDVVFLLEQTRLVAGLAKSNVDMNSKIALTEADLKLMQGRIVRAMLECVPRDRHAQFLGMIMGTGANGVLESLRDRGLASRSLPEGGDEAGQEEEEERAEEEVAD